MKLQALMGQSFTVDGEGKGVDNEGNGLGRI